MSVPLVAAAFSSSSAAFAAAAATTITSRNESNNESTEKHNAKHLVVLVHGWMGNDAELNYLESALQSRAFHNSNNNNEQLVVHSAKANVGRTHDGIVAGGTRLAEEVAQLVETHQQPPQQDNNRSHSSTTTTSLSLSFVGNSLGGLYARYALSLLDLRQVRPLVFCTTATPHLGVSQHTYVRLPRAAEWVVANVLLPTGRDLFGYTSIVSDLAHDDLYVRPLRTFAKRIAYANAYATDFQVPTATAAFLSASSDVPHRTVVPHEDSNHENFVLTVETLPTSTTTTVIDNDDYGINNGNDNNNNKNIAQALDSLGWTKVFCDHRDNIPLPAVPLPSFVSSSSSHKMTHHNKEEWTSGELLEAMSAVGTSWKIPLGHTVLVANSKSDWYARINEKGRPMVDQLAANLLEDIQRLSISDSDVCLEDGDEEKEKGQCPESTMEKDKATVESAPQP